MTPIRLSPRQRVELEAFLVHTPSAKARCRAQAVLWLDEGEAADRVAELLHVSRQTVSNWAGRFQQRQGLDLRPRLADAPRSGRPPTALGIIDPLIAVVIDRDPRDFAYHSTGWTAPLLRAHLEQAHGIVVSRKSASLALDRLGIVWKRPRYQLALRAATWRQAKGG